MADEMERQEHESESTKAYTYKKANTTLRQYCQYPPYMICNDEKHVLKVLTVLFIVKF